MRLFIDGEELINRYYVQTLCMLYFPGAKFSQDEEITASTPVVHLAVHETEGVSFLAEASLTVGERQLHARRERLYNRRTTEERTRKIAVGAAIGEVCSAYLGYRPSWGMLTGVRPSKVAMEMLLEGDAPGEVERRLVEEYQVIPKKAALAVQVARNEQKLIGTPDKRDCSVYISIPFCPTRCAYCSFVSYTSARLLSLIPDYLVKLEREIHEMFETIRHLGLRVRTVYIGGGTPTVLTPVQLESLLGVITRETDISALEEFTLEAGRPDTIDAEKLAVARAFGVGRISVNPQSLCPEVLQGIGRSHTVEAFYRAYDVAVKSGIPIINSDLIVGLPKDSFSTFSATFDKVAALAPANITVHTFCVKKSAEILQTMEHIYSIYGGDAGKCVDYSQIRAAQEGYIPYYMYRQKNTVGNFENVGFAKPGTEGRYNIYMMEEVHSIFAAGAGAVTKLVDYVPAGKGRSTIRRLFNPKYPYEYLREDGSAEMRAAAEQFYAQKVFSEETD